MMDLQGYNIVVLDLETARSAEDCQHCGHPQASHAIPGTGTCQGQQTFFEPIGWNDKAALGLSVGCYWDYADSRIHWFDPRTLEGTMRLLVDRRPLMVSFNGIGFDFSLMRGVLRQREYMDGKERHDAVHALCDDFKVLAAASYDILAEIWRADEAGKYERGLNSLDAIAEANGLGRKLSHGAQAPRDWSAGRYADVLNYCQDDVYKTKGLFEILCSSNHYDPGAGLLLRSNGPLILRVPIVYGDKTIVFGGSRFGWGSVA